MKLPLRKNMRYEFRSHYTQWGENDSRHIIFIKNNAFVDPDSLNESEMNEFIKQVKVWGKKNIGKHRTNIDTPFDWVISPSGTSIMFKNKDDVLKFMLVWAA